MAPLGRGAAALRRSVPPFAETACMMIESDERNESDAAIKGSAARTEVTPPRGPRPEPTGRLGRAGVKVMFVRKPLFAVAALVAAFVNIAPVAAQTGEAVVVSYADLNLANAAGRAALDRRIAFAARQVCGQFLITELEWAEMSRACRVDVTEAVRIPGATRLAGLRVSRAAY